MSNSAWIPPLDNNHHSFVHVTATQKRLSSQPSSSSGSSNSPLQYVINLYVTITYLCVEPIALANTKLKALSLSKTFHLPFDRLDRPTIAKMLNFAHFSFERFSWKAKMLNGFKSANILCDLDPANCLLEYLFYTRMYSSGNNQSLEVDINIDKDVFFPMQEFEGMVHTYEMHKNSSPGFEEEYQELISRPLTEEVTFERWAGPMARTFMTWKTYVEGGSEEDKFCSICSKRFVVGSRVPHVHNCEHKFHGSCITQWVDMNFRCPLCQYKISSGPY